MTDLSTLTTLAQAATPWRSCLCGLPTCKHCEAASAFACVCSPDTILGLVARVRVLEEAIDWLHEAACEHGDPTKCRACAALTHSEPRDD